MLEHRTRAWADYTHSGRPPGSFRRELFPMDLRPLHGPYYRHIDHFVPPFRVVPDQEMYRVRRKLLTPLTPVEEDYANTELYERAQDVERRMGRYPRALPTKLAKTNEILRTANVFVDENHELLDRLKKYYDPVLGRMLQNPDLVLEDPLAVSALASVLMAEEVVINGWPENGDLWEERKAEVEQLILGQDNENIMLMLPRAVDTLLIRELYWQAELGTLIGHKTLKDLDQAEEDYYSPAASLA